jgi:TRAP-type C4-dicarboxylate transport system permease small subunit
MHCTPEGKSCFFNSLTIIAQTMTKIVRGITSGINRLTWISEVLSEIALLGLLILVFHEVVVRYAFNSPTLFSVEISEYLLVFVAFISAGWVLKEDRHVRMLAVINLLPEKARLCADILTSFGVMIFCGILAWKGGQTTIMAYTGDYHSSSLLNFPLWIPYSLIPLGAIILGFQYIIRIGDHIKTLTKSKNGSNET